MNYENHLAEKINYAMQDLGFNFKFEVAQEQIFAKKKTLAPNTIYIVVKYLTSNITSGAKTQPLQIMILSDQNEINNVKMLFDKFANDNNFKSYTDGNEYIKEEYSSPVVISNFADIANGYRSMLYISGRLFILKDVIEVKNLEIDGVAYEPLTFNINYGMSGNTQSIGGDYLASTVKSVSTLNITMSIPLMSNALMNKVLGIMNGTISGNSDFEFEFSLGGINFNDNFKLTSAPIMTAVNQIPSIQLGFMR